MDEPVKTILTAIGTILAGGLFAFAGYITGKLNSRKDAAKVALETDSQRNRSEETFRVAFAEEKVKTEKLERRVRYLIKRDKERDVNMADLMRQVAELQTRLDTVIKERDELLALKGA